MTIIVHHLRYSRSLRILWLLEELNLEYAIKTYSRDKDFRAPPEFARVHPLGRSPVVEVDGHVLAESGAVIEYFVEREQALRPHDPAALIEYRFFLHYAEGSTMTPLLVQLLMEKLREQPLPFFVKPIAKKIATEIESAYSTPALALHFGFVNDTLAKRPYFAGDEFSAADVQMLYPVEAALRRTEGEFPAMQNWLTRVKRRPAYQRAESRGGPAMPPRR
jgi:glutathione S-transferase